MQPKELQSENPGEREVQSINKNLMRCCNCEIRKYQCKRCVCKREGRECTNCGVCRKGAIKKAEYMKSGTKWRSDEKEDDIQIIREESRESSQINLDRMQTIGIQDSINLLISEARRELQITKHSIIGDGNCFFRCLSLYLYDTQEKHSSIREKVVKTIVLNRERYKHLVDNEDIETHVKNMALSSGHSATWATELEVLAASQTFDVEIYVRTKVGKNMEWNLYSHLGCYCNHEMKFITINHENQHYSLWSNMGRPCRCEEKSEMRKDSGSQKQDKTETQNVGSFNWKSIESEKAVEWVNEVYDEIVWWKAENIVEPPKCEATGKMIKEMTRLLHLYIENAPQAEVALKMLMIMPHLILQKPFKKSKTRENVESIKRRMRLWEEGSIEKLFEIAKEKTKSLNRQRRTTKRVIDKRWNFGNQMREGRVNRALNLLTEDDKGGILSATEETIQIIKDKHPQAKEAAKKTKCVGHIRQPDESHFESINAECVWKIAVRTSGAAGPSGLNAKGWRTILSRKKFGETATKMCSAIAKLARKLATEKCSNTEALMACRMVPIDKKPGCRPVGIGEILRRIIGKCIGETIKYDVREAAGNLQVCSGHQAGGEAAIHAMRKIFENEECDAVILVDASNAFNTINREAMLHNISVKCPTLAQFAKNIYEKPCRMHIAGNGDQDKRIIVESSEGTTQGDPIAMAMYAVGISEMQNRIAYKETQVKQVGYADDLVGAGKLENLREWWNKVEEIGPDYGYYPNANKSWLITKPDKIENAKEIFKETNLQITDEGQKHLGAVIGSNTFRERYVKQKVREWVSELQMLSEMAETEPHAAYTAFTFGLKHKWTYASRTIPGIGPLLHPLEECIKKNFIPKLTKQQTCTDLERELLSLPARLGGLGLTIPSLGAEWEFRNSESLTSTLVDCIITQDQDKEICDDELQQIKKGISKERQERQIKEHERIMSNLSRETKRRVLMAQEIGASNWLTTLPIKAKGFSLNKQEFIDTIARRYGWPIEDIPDECACGSDFNDDHAQTCKMGRSIAARHDEVRDITAQMLKEIIRDVTVEPKLQAVTGETFHWRTANTAEDARLDISANGFWRRGQRAFFDIRIINPMAHSHQGQTLEQLHRKNEKEKMRKYSERVIKIEQGSFTPLVFTTAGGMGPQAKTFYNRLAELMSEKKGEPRSQFTAWMRTRLSFSLIRSALFCLRNTRTSKYKIENIENLDFEDAVLESRIMR